MRTGNAAEVGFRRVAEIEDDEAEVGVAGKEIGRLQGERGRRGGGATADPDEMGEQVGGMRVGVEGVGGVDQAYASAGAAGDCEKLTEEQLAAAAGGGADDLGDGAERKAAAGDFIERGDGGAQRAARGAGGGGEALGEQMPKRREFVGRG